MFNTIIVHYGEIGIKGENRPYFERMLVTNIKKRIANYITEIKRYYGRIIVFLTSDARDHHKEIETLLTKIPGIATFSFAISCPLDYEKIAEKLLELAKAHPPGASYRIKARRSFKRFPYTSMQLNQELGGVIWDNFETSVNLTTPERIYYVDITEHHAFLYIDKQEGLRGLPIGVSGKVLVLLSGGIDSPVAAYRMMKRGCSVTLLHFYNNQTGLREKIIQLAKTLSEFQTPLKLYVIPFREIQQQIIAYIPARYRMLTYRRYMFQIGNILTTKEKSKAFVTGDSVSQVASQTLDNIQVTWSVAQLPVLAPLIGYDKEEIIQEAKKIGTYEYSILPYSDCCSFLIDPHPATRADLETLESLESQLDLKEQIDKALNEAEIHSFPERK